MITIENECFNCMQMVSCKVITIENTTAFVYGSAMGICALCTM